MPGKKVKLKEDGNRYVTKGKVNSKGELTDVKVRRTVKGLVTGAPSVKKAEAMSKMKKGGVKKTVVKKYQDGGMAVITPPDEIKTRTRNRLIGGTVTVTKRKSIGADKNVQEKSRTVNGKYTQKTTNKKTVIDKTNPEEYGETKTKSRLEKTHSGKILDKSDKYKKRYFDPSPSLYKKGGMSCSCGGKGCMKCGGKKYMDGGKKNPTVKNIKTKDGVKQSYTSKDGLYNVKKEFDTKGKLKSKNVSRTEKLSPSDLKALSHQERGMGNSGVTSFVKNPGSIVQETGFLTNAQNRQLRKHMSKAGTLQKIYEALPNAGRIIGKSAADLPKNSILKSAKYKKGGMSCSCGGKGCMKCGGKKYMYGGKKPSPMIRLNGVTMTQAEKADFIKSIPSRPAKAVQKKATKTYKNGGKKK